MLIMLIINIPVVRNSFNYFDLSSVIVELRLEVMLAFYHLFLNQATADPGFFFGR